MNKFLLKIITIVFISCTILSCTDDKNEVETQEETLVKSELVRTISKEKLTLKAKGLGLSTEVLKLQTLKIYSLTYKTKNTDGKTIEASGALLIPENAKDLPIMSYQHGTISTQEEAPSLYDKGAETTLYGTILASEGLIISMPDYIGYNKSKQYNHPYEHASSLARSSYDMLIASKEFLKEKKIITSEKLYLAGYSEGASATMALHKYIEDKDKLKVSWSAPGSGPYDLLGTSKFFLGLDMEVGNATAYSLMLFDSFNKIYFIGKEWETIVNNSYVSKIKEISNPLNFIKAQIPNNPTTLFKKEFRESMLNGTEKEMLSRLEENSTFDWLPKAPITLYYGKTDMTVSPQNTLTAYTKLKANGANVSVIACQGNSHSNISLYYILELLKKIKE